MATVRAAALGVRFFLELAALVALAYWGLNAVDGRWAGIALGVAAPFCAAALWGAFVAPKRAVETAAPVRLAVEGLFFGAATTGLWASGQRSLALALAAAAVIDRAALWLVGERDATLRGRPAPPRG